MANPFTDGYWAYNTVTGEIKHVSFWEWEFKYSLLTGVWLPYNTKEEAEKQKAQHPPKKPKTPVQKIIGGIVDPGTGVKEAGDAVTSVTNDVLKPLFQANLWIRVAEVALGIILIAVGLARITNAVPIATKIAKTAGMVAAV
ncbi:hypothetical protein [Actinomadura sp. NPDC048394]|uniref:hypothetical protein n=1 Tax=Actinomadura sp. NPDC048394 TaxID=3158223 RepID=UPI00340ECB92